MEEKIIPPKSEWKEMTVQQLLDVKLMMSDRYYNMRSINASFAEQYLKFISELDAWIERKTEEAQDQ